MAENSTQDRTEEPTAKRREEARKQGQVVKSAELNSVVLLSGGVLALYFLAVSLVDKIIRFTTQVYRTSSQTLLNPITVKDLTENGLNIITDIVSPILLLLLILGIVVNLVQVGVSFSIEPIKPKISKINIFKGFKKIISPKSLVELIKSIIKMSIVGTICFYIIKNQLPIYTALAHSPVHEILSFVGQNMFKIFMLVSLAMIFPAIADFAYNKYEHEKNLKMTKEEVKDERKQSEGNPKVKSKIRSLQMQASRRRMMQAVPDATVVVTNPTHLAIAIKYKIGWEGKAPLVLAKGQRKTAQRIKEIAREHGIPVVEDKPLARALYSIVEIGMEIPNLFFQAVAEILAKVFQNQKRAS